MLALGIGGGIGAGMGIDALFEGRTLVYREPPRALTVRPVLGDGRRGVQLAVRF